jgi:YidC/Oxa1 family membrane protein insertase
MLKDKKTLLGIGLIVVIIIVWTIFNAPSKEKQAQIKARKEFVRDSIAKSQRQQQITDSLDQIKANQPDSSLFKDSSIAKLPDELKQKAVDSLLLQKTKDSLGVFASHGSGTGKVITVETEKFLLTFNSKGGLLYRCQMIGYQNYKDRFVEKNKDTLDLWIPGESKYNLTLLSEGKGIESTQLYFDTDAKSTKIKGSEKTTLRFKAFANNDKTKYLEYVYTITGNEFMVDFDVNMVGLNNIIEPNIAEMAFVWTMHTPSQEREAGKERESSNIWYSSMDGDVSQLKGGVAGNKEKKEVKYPLKWVSFKQQYFSAALIPSNGFTSKSYRMQSAMPETKEDPNRNKNFEAELAVPYSYGPSESFKMRMYMGPNDRRILKSYHLGLQEQIDLGYIAPLNRWLIIPVFNLFHDIGWNIGLIILMLTLAIKIITLPLTYRTFVSSSKMRLLKPDIDALSEKFKPEEALAKQQAVMALYKRAGVSPLSGCIPALLQMPILFAMIAFFPAEFALRQEGLLWANDMSTYDAIINLPFKIPAYGAHVSLFALLMTITTIFYTKMNSGQMTAQGGIQAQQMKIMMYLMPVVFLVFLNTYSAALSYYYFLSNLISILLMLFIRRFMIDEKKLHAQIEENKKKTPKKSKWMSRMEDIQKTRQAQIRQQQKGGKKK